MPKVPKPTPKIFDPWSEEQTADFFRRYRNWEALVQDAFLQTAILKPGEAALPTGLNWGAKLRRIPRKERERLMSTDPKRSFKSLIGWDPAWDVAAAAGDPQKHMASLISREGSEAYRFLLDPTQLSGRGTNPLAVLFAFLYPNVNTSNRAAGLKLGTNVPTADFLENWTNQLRAGVKITPGKKVFMFDVETGGLYEEGGVRQIAGRMMEMGPGSKLAMKGDMVNEYFDTSAMHLGYLHDIARSESIPMSSYVESLMPPGKSMARMGYGEDFANKMTPVLHQMLEADYITGHNVNFDIGQVFRGMQATTAYNKNVNGFADLLDQVIGKHSQGSIIDTAAWARSSLHGLSVHHLLEQQGKGTPFAMENLMFQTDLYEKMLGEVGEGRLHAMLGVATKGGAHEAHVDVDIESYLFQYLHEGSLKFRTDPRSLAMGAELPLSVQRALLKGYAPTPVSKIVDTSLIHPALRKELEASDDISPLRDIKGNIIQDAEGPIGYHVNLNPIEQQIWATRKLGVDAAVSDPEGHRLMQGLGDWRRFTGQDNPFHGMLNQDASLFRHGEVPTPEAFAHLQEKLASQGMPFSHLSMPEMWLSNTVAQAGAIDKHLRALMGHEGRNLMELGSGLQLGRFNDIPEAYITKAAGHNISLPTTLIQAAERERKATGEHILTSNLSGDTEDLQWLGLSAFRKDDGGARVHQIYKFKDEDEAKSMALWLRQKADLGLDEASIPGEGELRYSLRELGFHAGNIDQIIEELPKSGMQHGIGVGFLEGDSAEMVYGTMGALQGGEYRDFDAMPFESAVVSAKGGIVETGPYIEQRFGDEAVRHAGYKTELGLAVKQEGRLREKVGKASGAAEARSYFYAPETMHATIGKIMEGFDLLRSHGPLVVGSLAAAGGLLAWHRHKKKTEAGNATIKQMPTESRRDYYNYRRQLNLGPAPAQRAPDPLLTAGVVGNMDRSRINHMIMGSGKYQNLYSGAL